MEQLARVFLHEHLFLALVLGGLVWAVGLVWGRRRRPEGERRAWRFFTLIVSILVSGGTVTAFLTLTPWSTGEGRVLEPNPLGAIMGALDGWTPWSQVLGNVLLLTWLGFAIGLWFARSGRLRWGLGIGAIAATSLLIEVWQFVLDIGRVTSLSDLFLNTTGATLAMTLTYVAFTPLFRDALLGRRHAVAAVGKDGVT